MSELPGIAAPERLFRVGRPPDPWAWPPWHAAGGDGEPVFAGIEYESRLGDTYQNWAIFERPGLTLEAAACSPIEPDNPALQGALKVLGVRLGE